MSPSQFKTQIPKIDPKYLVIEEDKRVERHLLCVHCHMTFNGQPGQEGFNFFGAGVLGVSFINEINELPNPGKIRLFGF